MALLYGLRMGGLTQGKTLQQMGAMHSADGSDAFGRWGRCIRQMGAMHSANGGDAFGRWGGYHREQSKLSRELALQAVNAKRRIKELKN